MNEYRQAYIDARRSGMERQLAAQRALAKSAKKSTLDSFEPLIFNNLVPVLDNFFVHRRRGFS